MADRTNPPLMMSRRRWLSAAALALPVAGLWPDVHVLAQQAQDFITGAPVPDIAPQRVSPRVWMIYAPDGFPTPENRGMMSNVCFVVTSAGVVILDSGSSLQIGQMALRVIRSVTPLPVVAVFNSHFHGDHWLGNHAFALAQGPELPIYALPKTIEAIKGVEGNAWRALLERWTNQSTAGTQIVPPNRSVTPGQVIAIGDVHFKMHHHGSAHTPADLSVQVMEEGVTAVGDVVMGNRIANMDDGTYVGSFAYCKALAAQAGDQLWLPGHGQPARDLLARYTRFLAGIWEPCLQAVKDNQTEAQARARVLADPRVAERAATMQGFANNIGKYISLAYLEAEKEAF
jgi:glyoxylase-like metal-dependent hydrolase (beta-lactamase superfamily II)